MDENKVHGRSGSGALRSKKRIGGLSVKKVIGRCFLVVGIALLFAIIALFSVCGLIAHGPSETVRDALVLSAMQASATKWVPGVFLSSDVVDDIMNNSEKTDVQVISIEELNEKRKPVESDTSSETSEDDPSKDKPVDEWANAIDGMIFKTMRGATFKAYVLLVKDPSRIYVGTSSNYQSGAAGLRIFEMAEKENCVAAINGGEYEDKGGTGTGSKPMGLTYSKGACVWEDSYRHNFFGFDKDNRLVATDSMTKSQAETLGIRDGVSFQTGNVLITNDGSHVQLFRSPNNTGLAQRTAIGQRADGTVILIVTDGRTASSLGATHDDMIDMMLELGAVTAGLLDGGSSAMMYYKDWYNKYHVSTDDFDQYQMQGLINKYKAFTPPRRLPTCFCVAAE